MKSNDGIFRFKHFGVSHCGSSMKVGVDGVLIGAWAAVDGGRGLDIGCGCGLIALMAAQRNPEATVTGIDIDDASISEAEGNFHLSPWSQRLETLREDAVSFSNDPDNKERFDFIISNPPFFTSGPHSPSVSRERARHASSLSPSSLLTMSERLLAPGGTLSMILPYQDFETLPVVTGIFTEKLCCVSDKPSGPYKRIMACYRKGTESITEINSLSIRDAKGDYSADYKRLTADFYLNF